MPFFDNTRKPMGFGREGHGRRHESGPSGAGGLGAFLWAGGLPKGAGLRMRRRGQSEKAAKAAAPAAMSPERTIPPSAWKNPKR